MSLPFTASNPNAAISDREWRYALRGARVQATRYCGRHTGEAFDLDDLHQEAMLAVWQAAQDYDPARGVPFTTVAWRQVWSSIREARRSWSHVAAYRQKEIRQGGATRPYELPPLSLTPFLENDDASPTWEPDWDQLAATEAVRNVLAGLTPRDRYLLWERWAQARPLREVAAELGLSHEGVRKRCRELVARLRPVLAEAGLGASGQQAVGSGQ